MEACEDDSDGNAVTIYVNSSLKDAQYGRRCGSGGSNPGRRNIDRHHEKHGRLFMEDYWGMSPVYPPASFKKLFRVSIDLFDEILCRVQVHDEWFEQKKNNAGRMGISSIRMLTSGVGANEFDDKYRMGASTILERMKRFCEAVNEIYGKASLRVPNELGLNRLLDEGNEAGYPGCIGSIDCMHWEWKNCPSAWKGMFQGKEGVPTVVLEAIADHCGRFWHFNFGSPGTLNDINILDRSPLFHNSVSGVAPRV
jgi:Plant transposon protein